MNRELYLIDVDGVVADFSGALLRSIGVRLEEKDITQWDLFGLLTSAERDRAFTLLKDPHFWQYMPLIRGTQASILEIAKHHEVMFLSAPWAGCREWEAARRDWIAYHFGKDLSKKFISAPSEQKYLVRGSLIIDDKTSTIDAWHDHNPEKPAWLFDAPYNRSDKPLYNERRLSGWPEDPENAVWLHNPVVYESRIVKVRET